MIIKIARSCHSEDDPASLSCYVSWGAVASFERDGLFLICFRTCRPTPPHKRNLFSPAQGFSHTRIRSTKKVRCVACYSEDGAWRRSIGRRLVFTFVSRGCSQDARAQGIGKDDDQR